VARIEASAPSIFIQRLLPSDALEVAMEERTDSAIGLVEESSTILRIVGVSKLESNRSQVWLG